MFIILLVNKIENKEILMGDTLLKEWWVTMLQSSGKTLYQAIKHFFF